jgi:alkanesulfonate monooxygenase SsuD/methylene tetrahydromethanopterin reductase-like flavin-dependent oxidoreductase (luciferase family)
VLLAAIAGATTTIRLGTTVTALPRRDPVKLAREAMTLDHLSGGRVTLGVGVGDADRGVSAIKPSRSSGQRLEERLDVLLAVLSGRPVGHRGPEYAFDDVTFRPAPVQQPRLPVWVGGSTQAGAVATRAARADGVVPYKVTDTREWEDFTAAEIERLIARIRDLREGSGLPAQPFDVALGGRRRRPDETAERHYLDEVEAAGATWWLEFVPAADPGTMRSAIARGPLWRAA